MKNERQPKIRIMRSSLRMSFFSACGMSVGYHLTFVRNRSHSPSLSDGGWNVSSSWLVMSWLDFASTAIGLCMVPVEAVSVDTSNYSLRQVLVLFKCWSAGWAIVKDAMIITSDGVIYIDSVHTAEKSKTPESDRV